MTTDHLDANGDRLPALDECSYCGLPLTTPGPCPAQGADDAAHLNWTARRIARTGEQMTLTTTSTCKPGSVVGYWDCPTLGGCRDCRSLAREADDQDQLEAWAEECEARYGTRTPTSAQRDENRLSPGDELVIISTVARLIRAYEPPHVTGFLRGAAAHAIGCSLCDLRNSELAFIDQVIAGQIAAVTL